MNNKKITINWLKKDEFGYLDDKDNHSIPVDPCTFIHIIEYRMKLTYWKKAFLLQCLEKLSGSIMVIDISSIWYRVATVNERIHYMNTTSLIDFTSFHQFLIQLDQSPIDALLRCNPKADFEIPLNLIIIDNISYYTHDPTVSYDLLFQSLKRLNNTFGCAIITFGFGLDYYNGLENSFNDYRNNHSHVLPTRMDHSYMTSMDLSLINDIDTNARIWLP